MLTHDFVYSWRRLFDPNTAAPYAQMYPYFLNSMDMLAGKLHASSVVIRALDYYIRDAAPARSTDFFLALVDSFVFFSLPRQAIVETKSVPPTSLMTGCVVVPGRGFGLAIGNQAKSRNQALKDNAMSRKLLNEINGHRDTRFSQWLSKHEGNLRIAWYPSAGQDFRDLLFLSPQYRAANPIPEGVEEPDCPNLYLHTDYSPSSTPGFLDAPTLHNDGRTAIKIQSMEELGRCNLDRDIVAFPDRAIDAVRTVFMEVEVRSNWLGTFNAAVLYVFARNEAFCAQRMLAHDARVSHVIHVRYGNSFGGADASGIWLKNILRRFRCEYFINDGQFTHERGAAPVYALFPELQRPEETGPTQVLRTVPSSAWSGCGDVSWEKLLPCS